jgi:hypothetical protein
MTDEQRARKNQRDRERRAAQRARREANGGINPATKLPHTDAYVRGTR